MHDMDTRAQNVFKSHVVNTKRMSMQSKRGSFVMVDTSFEYKEQESSCKNGGRGGGGGWIKETWTFSQDTAVQVLFESKVNLVT